MDNRSSEPTDERASLGEEQFAQWSQTNRERRFTAMSARAVLASWLTPADEP